MALLEGHENEVKCAAWSPSGQLLATCARDKSVWIWEAAPGNEFECVDVQHGHTQDVKMVAWHPNGEWLASCSYDNTIRLWAEDADDWHCAQVLGSEGAGGGHASTVWAVAFEPGGRRMVSCGDDRDLRVWDCVAGEGGAPRWRCAATVAGMHDRTIFSVHWGGDGGCEGADGALIATGAGDDCIRVFSDHVPGEKGVFSLVGCREHAHSGDVNCVRWSPRERGLLASCGDDQLVKLWRYRHDSLQGA